MAKRVFGPATMRVLAAVDGALLQRGVDIAQAHANGHLAGDGVFSKRCKASALAHL